MWRPFSISTKIWLSLSILVFGYFISMAIGYLLGQNNESRLYSVSEFLFPASRHSQLALSSFNEQIKLYKDAIFTGEDILVESAQVKADESQRALQTIIGLRGLNDYKRTDISETLKRLKKFTASAQDVYAAISRISEDKEYDVESIRLKKKALSLASQIDDSADCSSHGWLSNPCDPKRIFNH